MAARTTSSRRSLPAAFYYKTFMWPRSAWHRWYEPPIRRAAGLGRAPSAPDPDRYAQRFAHCDVLVVGAGPAGLAAALAASASGARVMLCDEQPEPGGSLLDEHAATIDGQPAQQWLAAAIATLAARPNVTLLHAHDGLRLLPAQPASVSCERLTDHLAAPAAGTPRERLWQVRAREVVLATGAIERPLVFPGNDRPGVMLASAGSTYLHRYGVSVGSRIVVVTRLRCGLRDRARPACGRASTVALDRRRARRCDGAGAGGGTRGGLEVVDRRDRPGDVAVGWACAASSLARLSMERSVDRRTIACDALLMSGGYTPSVHLFSQSRGKLAWDDGSPGVPARRSRRARALGGGLPRRRRPRVGARGRRARPALAAARAAGRDAAAAADTSGRRVTSARWARRARCGSGARQTPSRAFVDFQNDVTTKDLALAAREGFVSIEHIKRYTTAGMATDQGKTSNMNALAIVADGLGATAAGRRAHHVPHAVHAGDVRRARRLRPRRSVRPGAHDADARVGAPARSRVRGRGAVEARALFSAGRRRPCTRPSRANAAPCARRAASSTRRRSARSRSSDRTPRRSCRACTSTTLRASRSAAAATASCCATTASSTTTA